MKVLGSSVMFKFLDEVSGKAGSFSERYTGQIQLVKIKDNQTKIPRWGEVTHIGESVKDVTVGDFILIEPLQWTSGMVVDDVKYWKTVEDRIIAITNDIKDTFNF